MKQQAPFQNPDLALPNERSLCLDIGSRYISAGFACEDTPRIRFSTVLSSEGLIGNDCTDPDNKTDIPFGSLSWPVQKGEIVDWDKMDKIWNHIWNHPKLDTASDLQPLLVSEVAGNPKENRKQLAEILFEKYSVPDLFFCMQPVLAMYSTGKTSGLVLDIGHHLIQSVPMYEGFALDHAILRHEMGGLDITLALRAHLIEEAQKSNRTLSIPTQTAKGFRFIELIKEDMGAVPMDYRKAQYADDKEYILPDRTRIQIGTERFLCGEALFTPSLIQKDSLGIHEIIFSSYDKCDNHVQKLIEQNIVLSGGSSKFDGITSRLEKELNQLISSEQAIIIDAPRERHIASWVGASILASLPTFEHMLVSKQKYEEDPDSIDI